MLSDKKIDIRRRPTVGTTISSTGWFTEIHDVTDAVTSTGRVTLSHTPVIGSEIVMLNGLVVYADPSWDYQMSGVNVVFNVGHNLTTGDTIRIKYQIYT